MHDDSLLRIPETETFTIPFDVWGFDTLTQVVSDFVNKSQLDREIDAEKQAERCVCVYVCVCVCVVCGHVNVCLFAPRFLWKYI